MPHRLPVKRCPQVHRSLPPFAHAQLSTYYRKRGVADNTGALLAKAIEVRARLLGARAPPWRSCTMKRL